MEKGDAHHRASDKNRAKLGGGLAALRLATRRIFPQIRCLSAPVSATADLPTEV